MCDFKLKIIGKYKEKKIIYTRKNMVLFNNI